MYMQTGAVFNQQKAADNHLNGRLFFVCSRWQRRRWSQRL